jgi:cytochrome P450
MQYHLPPGPKSKPLVGNLLEFCREPLNFLSNLQQQYGKASMFLFGRTKMILFTTPQAARYVLVENSRNFPTRNAAPEVEMLLGNGLLVSEGDFYQRQRRLVLPAFHRKRVESYRDIIVMHTEQMLKGWQLKKQVDMLEEMQHLALGIVTSALFNVDLTQESSVLSALLENVRKYLNRRRFSPLSFHARRINLPFTTYGRFVRAKALLDKTIYDVVANRRALEEDTGDIVSMLLAAQDEDGSTLTDTQIRDEIMTILAAGHVTTADSLAWTFYLLSQHPLESKRLLAELSSILNGRAPRVEDLTRLPYLEMVIKESMRLFPPVWTMVRRAVDDYELEGYRLPAGSLVLLSPWVFHRMAEYFNEPERFRPERFDPERGERHQPFTYLPFGAGSRICIGSTFAMMELTLIVATVLQHYHPRLVANYPVEPAATVTLWPKFGVHMLLDSVK